MRVTNDFHQSCLDEKGNLILSGLVQYLIDTNHFASSKGRLRHYDDHLGCWMDVTDENPNMAIHDYIADDCKRLVNARVMKHVVHDLIASPELVIKLNDDSYKLNVLNGIVDLKTGKLHPHDKKHGFSYCRKFSYDENASPDHIPHFTKYLKTSIGCKVGDDTYTEVMEVLGYAVSNLRNAKKAMFLYGESNTGKSQLLRLVESTFDDAEISSIGIHDLGTRFKAAELIAGHVNILDEISPDPIPCVSEFKSIVSCEPLTTEEKGKPFKREVPHTVLISATNQLPTFNVMEVNESLMNRILLIVYRGKIDEKDMDRNLASSLIAEKDAIFSLAVSHLPALIKRNMAFVIPKDAKLLLDNHAKEANSVKTFVEEECEMQGKVFSKTLYEAYQKHCKRNMYHEQPSARFLDMIRMLPGVTNKKIRIETQSLRGYTGISLKENGTNLVNE